MKLLVLNLAMTPKALLIIEGLIIEKMYESLGILVKIILKKKKFYFRIVSDLWKSCEDLTEFT